MDKLNKLIGRVFGIDKRQISDDLGPSDIEKWDSLTQILLISAIEAEYKVTFDVEEILNIMKIGDMRSILRVKLAKKNGS